MAEINARSGGRRRTRNEINMVPFIDVMLVLLIIFMVSAPLMPTGVVDLPSVGQAKQVPEKVIEVLVEGENEVAVRVDRQERQTVALRELAALVKGAQEQTQGGPQAAPVIISAGKDVRYESVVRIMDTLQRGGVVRVGLTVRTGGA